MHRIIQNIASVSIRPGIEKRGTTRRLSVPPALSFLPPSFLADNRDLAVDLRLFFGPGDLERRPPVDQPAIRRFPELRRHRIDRTPLACAVRTQQTIKRLALSRQRPARRIIGIQHRA